MSNERRDSDDEAAVVSALLDATVSLASVSPDPSTNDLAPLCSAIGDANVIGLGEASHGTREFFQFKARFVRHLVEDHDLRLLGIEANFAALLSVNEYVLDGEGTVQDALEHDAIHAPYRSDSFVELLQWLHEFNTGRPRTDRVRVHGVDVQHPAAACTRLQSYFEMVDSAVLETVRGELETLIDDGIPDVTDDDSLRTHLDARDGVVTTLGESLADNETAYVEASSRRAYQRARRFVWLLDRGRDQFEAIYDGRAATGANVRIRDSAMAAQVQWLLDHAPGDRMALWGHNAHLTRGSFGGGTTRHKQGISSLGSNLARLSGIEYYALGLLLGGGTVTAMAVPEGEPRAYDIEDPPAGSIPNVFGRVDEQAFFLDIEGLPADSPLSRWLDSKPPQYDVVGGYRNSPVNLVETNLRRQFDGVVFVSESTPARW